MDSLDIIIFMSLVTKKNNKQKFYNYGYHRPIVKSFSRNNNLTEV